MYYNLAKITPLVLCAKSTYSLQNSISVSLSIYTSALTLTSDRQFNSNSRRQNTGLLWKE